MDSLEKTEYEQWKKRAGWVGLAMVFVWGMALFACVPSSGSLRGYGQFFVIIPGLIISGSCLAMFLYVSFLEKLVLSQERKLQLKDEYIEELRFQLKRVGG